MSRPILRPTGKSVLTAVALAGLVALIVLMVATAALGSAWLPGQQPSEPVAAPHALDHMNRASIRTLPVAALPAPPTPRPVAPAPAPAAATGGYSDAFFDCLAEKESSGEPLGCARYCGRLQWLPSTWRDAGGTKYASLPQYATWEQEKAVARSWLARPDITLAGQWPPSRNCLHLR